jgi:F-type H+-transporting ATPase subunit b
MESLVAPTFNLLILLGVMAYYLRAPIKKTVSERHFQIRDEVERVSLLLKKAQEQLEEFTSKLNSLGTEATALREQARQDGKNMRLRIINEARASHEIIIKEAKAACLALYMECKEEIQRSFSSQVIEQAEGILKAQLTGDDRMRIRHEFSKQMVSIQ